MPSGAEQTDSSTNTDSATDSLEELKSKAEAQGNFDNDLLGILFEYVSSNPTSQDIEKATEAVVNLAKARAAKDETDGE